MKRNKLKTKLKITSDATHFNMHVNSKSNNGHEVKFIIAICKNPEPSSKNLPPPSHLKILKPPHSAKLLKSL